MPYILEPSVTAKQELIVPKRTDTIGSMEKNEELVEFSRRMHEICDDMKIPKHGRQSALAKEFQVSQKGARKWLEAESFPRWEHLIRITKWAAVTIEWLLAGRGPKRTEELYPTQAIARVAHAMQAMPPEQQYLVARLTDQIAQPIEHDPPDAGRSGPEKKTSEQR